MILVNKSFMTPRATNVVVLEDKDGDYIYVDRNLYDNAVIFNHTTQGDLGAMEKSVLGGLDKNSINKDILTLMLDVYATAPEPLNVLISFLLIADNIVVPKGLEGFEAKEFTYNLLDVITNSIDVRTYVKLPDKLRNRLSGIQHLAKTYKERIAHTIAMWFTGVEIVPISQISYSQVPVETPAPAQHQTPTEQKPLPIPAGSVTTIPAADKESATPEPNTISEEEFLALQKLLEDQEREFEEKTKKREEEKKKPATKMVEVTKEVSDRAEIDSIFTDVLKGL